MPNDSLQNVWGVGGFGKMMPNDSLQNVGGYAPAIRGIGVKLKCECCVSPVNEAGSKRHQKTHVEILEIQHLMYQQA